MVNQDIPVAVQDHSKRPVYSKNKTNVQKRFQAVDEDLHFNLVDAVIILREINQAPSSVVSLLSLNDLSSSIIRKIRVCKLVSHKKTQEILNH